MSERLRSALVAIATAAVMTLLGLAVRPSAGQSGGFRPPRTPDGHPNISGIWQAVNTANWNLTAHAASPAVQVRPGRVEGTVVPAAPVLALGAAGGVPAGLGVVEGEEIPYQPWAAARQKENSENWLARDPEVRCFLPGVPRANYMPYPFQILQSRDKVTMTYEFASARRTVHVGGKQEAPADSWMGYSNGRYEGESLVVDVTGFNDQTWFDRAGNFHSEALHVVERYTPSSAAHLDYEATIEDPKVFTRPWKIRMPLYRRVDRNAQVLEYKCPQFVEELMFGKLRREPLPVVADFEKWYSEFKAYPQNP